MKLTKIVDIMAIVMLLGLVLCGFMVMKNTADSNAVTADIATIQAKHKKSVIIEVGLLTVEMRNLQKDIAAIRNQLDEEKKRDARD